jgi:hypothetical protein
MILAMEKQAMALSSASMNAENYRQTQQINETLKTINKGMTVDKVDDMMYVALMEFGRWTGTIC